GSGAYHGSVHPIGKGANSERICSFRVCLSAGPFVTSFRSRSFHPPICSCLLRFGPEFLVGVGPVLPSRTSTSEKCPGDSGGAFRPSRTPTRSRQHPNHF